MTIKIMLLTVLGVKLKQSISAGHLVFYMRPV